MNTYDLTTRAGCMSALVDLRHTARLTVSILDRYSRAIRMGMRQVRLLRQSDDPFALRQADVHEKRVHSTDAEARGLREHLQDIGDSLFAHAPFIDRYVPRDLLLDLLNVNRQDRHALGDADGVVMIVFAHGLENSVEGRGKDVMDSPLFRACHVSFLRKLATDHDLQGATDEILFGHGGVLEFAPRYATQPGGVLVRQPPRLREADPAVDGRDPTFGGSDAAA